MRRTIPLHIILVALAGCGAPAPTPTSNFVGTWTAADGVTHYQCASGDIAAAYVGLESITAGSTSDIVAKGPDDCLLRMNIVSDRASIVAGQSCHTMIGADQADESFTTGTIVTIDGHTAYVNLAGTVHGASPVGSYSCPFITSARLVR